MHRLPKRAQAVFISRAEFARVNYPSFFIANSKRQELTTTAIFLVYSRSLLLIFLKNMEIKIKYTVNSFSKILFLNSCRDSFILQNVNIYLAYTEYKRNQV